MTAEGTPPVAARVKAALAARAPQFARRYELFGFAERTLLSLETHNVESLRIPMREAASPGVDFRFDRQLAMVQRWTEYAPVWDRFRTDHRINPGAREHPGWVDNEWFDSPDAESYASMIASRRPRRIVEIGGGYSTLIARATIDELGLDTELVVIDPEPRTDVTSAADEVRLVPVEAVDSRLLDLDSSSFLFIDSSHIVTTGTDIPHLFGAVIPELPPGTVVHVHDICLPYEYSRLFVERLYTEQYVLQALLAHTNRYEVVLAVHALGRKHPEELRSVFGERLGLDTYGSSFWFRVTDSDTPDELAGS